LFVEFFSCSAVWQLFDVSVCCIVNTQLHTLLLKYIFVTAVPNKREITMLLVLANITSSQLQVITIGRSTSLTCFLGFLSYYIL
jgi:hypothetical protein